MKSDKDKIEQELCQLKRIHAGLERKIYKKRKEIKKLELEELSSVASMSDVRDEGIILDEEI